jgi:hypothetical protein
MSQPWFRVDVEVVDHPKVHHLEAILGSNAGWYLIRLWTWTARYASRGRLATVARASLERSCGWTGKPGDLVAAFIATGLIDETTTDELEVHDWWEKQGATVQKAENDRERLKASRAARGIVARQSSDARASVAGDVTLRNDTRRNKSTAPKKPAPASESDRLMADFQEVIGTRYQFNGAKDGVALSSLLKTETIDEISARWRRGLVSEGWLGVRTIAQLRSKWNDLARPVNAVIDFKKPVPPAVFTESKTVEDF